MKVGIVSAEALASKNSLRAQDHLCPNHELEQEIARLEKSEARIQGQLRRKKTELALKVSGEQG